MNCKPDDLAVVIKSYWPAEDWSIGKVFRCVSVFTEKGYPIWIVDPAISGRSGVCDLVLRPIRDQPGNESWFTAAPKSRPATAKGDTIDARGEVV